MIVADIWDLYNKFNVTGNKQKPIIFYVRLLHL